MDPWWSAVHVGARRKLHGSSCGRRWSAYYETKANEECEAWTCGARVVHRNLRAGAAHACKGEGQLAILTFLMWLAGSLGSTISSRPWNASDSSTRSHAQPCGKGRGNVTKAAAPAPSLLQQRAQASTWHASTPIQNDPCKLLTRRAIASNHLLMCMPHLHAHPIRSHASLPGRPRLCCLSPNSSRTCPPASCSSSNPIHAILDPTQAHLELDPLLASGTEAAVQLLIVLLAPCVHHAALWAPAGVEVALLSHSRARRFPEVCRGKGVLVGGGGGGGVHVVGARPYLKMQLHDDCCMHAVYAQFAMSRSRWQHRK